MTVRLFLVKNIHLDFQIVLLYGYMGFFQMYFYYTDIWLFPDVLQLYGYMGFFQMYFHYTDIWAFGVAFVCPTIIFMPVH